MGLDSENPAFRGAGLSEVSIRRPVELKRQKPFAFLRLHPAATCATPYMMGYAMTERVHVREYRRLRFGLVERVRRHTRRYPFFHPN